MTGVYIALDNAFRTNLLSAFDGLIAFNEMVDGDTARAIVERFYDGVIPPAYSPSVFEVFKKKKNLSLHSVSKAAGGFVMRQELRSPIFGFLRKDRDVNPIEEEVSTYRRRKEGNDLCNGGLQACPLQYDCVSNL